MIFPIPIARGSICATVRPKGGYSAVVIKLRLPNGKIYDQDGKLDYVSPTISETTDTLHAARGRSQPSVPRDATRADRPARTG